MPRFGETAMAHVIGKPLAGIADHCAYICVLFDEARQVLAAQPQHIFGDQHLTIAGRRRTNANGGHPCIQGDLPRNADPRRLARFIMTMGFGIAVQAANGLSPAELDEIVDTAMHGWPM